MTTSSDRSDQIRKLRDMVKDIDYGMLTTIDTDGSLHSRPMAVNKQIEFDGDLWFFTYADSHKVLEVQQHQQVNVSFSAPDRQQYVSMSGVAELVRDRKRLELMWQPDLKAWFPKGLEEPGIALIKVNVNKAEYWDAPAGWVAKTIGLAKSIATGERSNPADNVKLDLK
ncbi:pyridoxamine 5'-phosphate oxidase family protein [Leptolyngbya sp. FACHB-541]|uniref:pyridoxamine 5'-phosphate oxidase family protein n=1 Tax=Leptolyngbya sp. FACHB-541 TaxID=2692810 RepID=UPI0016889966|nr:pyridoxamine 5'-phosphate oxidase family protein [Leptolyngbya sp. FACHB-541]MBD1996454.1 pyridoxamine 5'-phosphate oxidase family protein [Leptolyngbya sp. FACHB-541]